MQPITDKSQIPQIGTQMLYFTSKKCGACKMLTPKLNRLVENKGYNNWYNIDIDQHELLGNQFKVEFIPTIIVLNNGKEIKRATGIKNIENI
jgi:thioredoxin 1